MATVATPCVTPVINNDISKADTPTPKTAETTVEKAPELPVIDLQDLKSEESYAKLRQACKDWGCFRAVNHGFPTELMAEVKAIAFELFDLPMEVKMRMREVNPGDGYMPPHEKNPILEALGVFGFASPEIVDNFCSKLDATPYQREKIEAYSKEITKLSTDILNKLATSFGVTGCDFENWNHQFRMNRYTFNEDAIGSTGVVNHTDTAFLTILQEDEAHGGLEARSPSGEYVAVEPVPGTFLINLGDIAVPWSNGQLCNMQHRVLCKAAGKRISIVTFIAPQPNEIIETPPQFVEADSPAKYVPFTYGEYRRMRFQERKFVGEYVNSLLKTDQCA